MRDLLAAYNAASPAKQRRIDRILRDVPPTFRAWNERVTPAWRWDWPHIARLQDSLERVTEGEIDRLIIEMPPRHGTSEKGQAG